MKHLTYHITLLLLWTTHVSLAQISPGDLTSAHAELEGMSNCTACHVLGQKVTDAKCLECHKEIQSLLDQKRGFHSSTETVNKDCAECHSEHHGRKFDMMRFDQENFDHDLTGYILDGKHATIECRDCHKSDYIADLEIRKREETFLGLEQDCLSCHDDFHQNTLSNDCLSCHDTEAFRPAPRFDHDNANFQLQGAHIEVDCIECHAMETRNGKEFQVFTDIPHGLCIDCHDDPHEEHFDVSCTQCHNENAWTSFIGDTGFDHNTTDFRLKGSHQTVGCFECHTNTDEARLIFQDRIGIPENDCISCHEDVHEGKFGTSCVDCHNEESWLALNNMDQFNHDLTDYPLEGRHIGVDCKECHEGSYTEPIDFSQCQNCHEDYHMGEFVENNVAPDCVECHSLNKGFEQTLYTVERHEDSEFPLIGGHTATPCFACHISEDRWTFRNIGLACWECHDDIHQGQFAVNGITDCESCHDSFDWYPRNFDHNETAFPLDGKHAEVDCRECHIPSTPGETASIIYKIEKFECIDCHQ